jgi:hypothetical protein
MTNPDFTLADLLRTAREIDMLDDPIVRIDDPVDPYPGEDIPIENDPIIRIDDPIDPHPGDIPFGEDPGYSEDDPIIRIDDPIDPQPGEDIPIGHHPDDVWGDDPAEFGGGPVHGGGPVESEPEGFDPPLDEGEVHGQPVEEAPVEHVFIEPDPTLDPELSNQIVHGDVEEDDFEAV